MSTFKALQDRIALDHLNRYDLMEPIKRAIVNCIKQYESQRYWFNMTASAVTVSAGDALVGAPADMVTLDRLEITYSGASYALQERTFAQIRQMNTVNTPGVPTHFAQRGMNFELAVTPNSAYPVLAYYVHRFPTLSADSDSNPWTTEAGNLIAHAATIDVLASALSIEKPQKLKHHLMMLQNAQKELHLRNTVRLTSHLQATRF